MHLLPNLVTRTLWVDLLKSSAFVALCLIALQMVFNMLGESGNLKRDYDFLDSVLYSLLMSGPGSLVFILPIVMLIATLLVLGRMSDSSELVVLQTSGLSTFSLFGKLLPVVLVICVTVMILEDLAFLPLRNQAIDMRNELRGHTPPTSGSLAIRQDSDFIIAESISPEGELKRAHLFDFDRDFRLVRQAVAEKGVAKDNRIVLHSPLVSRYRHENDAQPPTSQRLDRLDLEVNHSLRFLHWLALSNLTDTARLSFSELWEFARFQQVLNPRNNQFLQVFYNKLMLPFNILAFMLLVMPFIFGPTRTMNTSTKVIIAIMIGLVFINFQQLTLPVHVVFGLPPLLVAVIPGFLTLALALVLMQVKR